MTLPAITETLEVKSAPAITGTLEVKSAPVSGTAYPEPWAINLFGGAPTASKVRVNPRSAMSVPAVKRAVNLISGTLGVLPCRVLKIAETGETPATDHPAFPIVSRRANPWTAASDLRRQLTTDMLLHGDGFGLVVRVGGKPVEIQRLDPKAVTVELDETEGFPVYTVTINGAVLLLDWRDVVHVMAPSIDGVRGDAPIKLGREAIGLAITLERHAARLFGNGAQPGGVISFPKNIGTGTAGQAAATKIKTGWHNAFNGEGSGGTAVLDEGATFTPITLTSVDAETMAQRRHQTREIANVFGVPSTMLNDTEAQTYKNTENLAQAFRDECILPIVYAWESALERALLADDEFSTYRIALDTDALDRADLAAKSEALAKRRAAGVVTANEERRALNLPAHRDGDVLGSPYTTANAGKPAEAPANV